MAKKLNKKSLAKYRLPLVALLLIVIVACVISFNVASDSRKVGRLLGDGYGTIIGNMKGSHKGNQDGKSKGENDAKEPEPPTIVVVERLKEQGRLHVMEAKITYADEMRLGEKEDLKFAILFSEDASADYYVDLSDIEVASNTDGLVVLVPDVECEFIPIPETFTEIDRYVGKDDFSEKAHNMQVESQKEISSKIYEEFNSETTIKNQARETARKRVIDLAETLSGKSVSVKFVTKDGDYR